MSSLGDQRNKKRNQEILLGSSSKASPIAWENVCKPKQYGDLGIRDQEVFNKADLAKLRWKILTQANNWWVRITKNKYIKRYGFFDAKNTNISSMAWNGYFGIKRYYS